jgi:hypothetical protein
MENNEALTQEVELESQEAEQELEVSEPVEDAIQEEEQPVVTQSRFNKVYGRAMHAERELASMREELERLKSAQVTQQKTEPRLADFDYDEEKFKEALMSHKVDDVIRRREIETKEQALKQQREAEMQTRIQEYTGRASEYAKANPDYVALTKQASEFNIEFPPAVVELIFESPNGPALQHHLLKNPQEIEELAALPAHKQGVRLAHLERTILTKQKSKAPGVVPNVQAASKGKKDPASMTPEEYYAYRMNS